MNIAQGIEHKLRQQLAPQHLEVHNESHGHRVPRGFGEGLLEGRGIVERIADDARGHRLGGGDPPCEHDGRGLPPLLERW